MEQVKVRRRQLAFPRMSTHEVRFCFSFDGTEDHWEGIQTACMETLTKTTGKTDTAQQLQWNNQL